MACFSSMLRRASSSVVPLAIRSSRSSKTFHGVAAASDIGGNQRGGGSRRVLQFSTKTELAKVEPRGDEKNAKRVINGIVSEKNVKRAINRIVAEIDRKPMKEMAAPEELSPLKVFDDPNEPCVYFKWEYGNEIIKVAVCSDGYHGDFSVTVTKRGCELQLNFDVRAYSDTLSITGLSLNKKVVKDGSGSDEEEEEEEEKDGSASEEEEEDMEKDGEEEEEDDYETVPFHCRSYSGFGCEAVNENVLKDLLYYLEVRGINPITTKFFRDHTANKCRKRINKRHMVWLKNLKRFFEY